MTGTCPVDTSISAGGVPFGAETMMKFSLPKVPFTVPKSPRTGGNEYVWHCHILEHEEHDMMRPLVVRGSNPRA